MLKFEIKNDGGGQMEMNGTVKELTAGVMALLHSMYYDFKDQMPAAADYFKKHMQRAVEDGSPVWGDTFHGEKTIINQKDGTIN